MFTNPIHAGGARVDFDQSPPNDAGSASKRRPWRRYLLGAAAGAALSIGVGLASSSAAHAEEDTYYPDPGPSLDPVPGEQSPVDPGPSLDPVPGEQSPVDPGPSLDPVPGEQSPVDPGPSLDPVPGEQSPVDPGPSLDPVPGEQSPVDPGPSLDPVPGEQSPVDQPTVGDQTPFLDVATDVANEAGVDTSLSDAVRDAPVSEFVAVEPSTKYDLSGGSSGLAATATSPDGTKVGVKYGSKGLSASVSAPIVKDPDGSLNATLNLSPQGPVAGLNGDIQLSEDTKLSGSANTNGDFGVRVQFGGDPSPRPAPTFELQPASAAQVPVSEPTVGDQVPFLEAANSVANEAGVDTSVSDAILDAPASDFAPASEPTVGDGVDTPGATPPLLVASAGPTVGLGVDQTATANEGNLARGATRRCEGARFSFEGVTSIADMSTCQAETSVREQELVIKGVTGGCATAAGIQSYGLANPATAGPATITLGTTAVGCAIGIGGLDILKSTLDNKVKVCKGEGYTGVRVKRTGPFISYDCINVE